MTGAARHIIVSGGGSGVGAAIAGALARDGAAVTILGRTEDKLKAQNLPYQQCDVTDARAVASAFAAARSAHGPVSGVIANAGAVESMAFARMRPEDLDAMLALNLRGVFNVWQAGLADMKEAGRGRMIAVASTAGLKGYPYVSGYCAAKHAVVGLTRALAQELGSTGITVNAICPGYVQTPMLERSVAAIVKKSGMSPEAAAAALLKGNPQKRFISVDEVAAAALYLCSTAADSINGHTLTISGGEI